MSSDGLRRDRTAWAVSSDGLRRRVSVAEKQHALVGWTVISLVSWVVGFLEEGGNGSVELRVGIEVGVVVWSVVEGIARWVVWGGGV